MAAFSIHVVNEDFRSSEESEHPHFEAALRAAMKGALQIGADEVCAGKSFFGAEITILQDGEVLERRTLAIGSAPLHRLHTYAAVPSFSE